MKSTNNTRAIVVGIFVFLGLAIFIITILTLGSQHKTFENKVTVKSYFENVNGLQKGNNVWFSGVKVGTIKRVNLIGNGKVEVDIDVEEQSLQYIRKDAKAKISTDGLIGNKIIEIYGGTAKAPQIEGGDVLVNDKLLNTDEMMNTLSKNNDNINAITTDFKTVSKRLADGQGSIGKLLTDETMVDQINAVTIKLNKAATNLDKLSSNVSSYTARLNNKGTLANDLVTDTVIFSKLRETVSQLQGIATASQSAINNLDKAGTTLNNGLKDTKSPIGMMLNDEQSATQLKMTLQNLNSATKKLDEDLEAAQHNFLLRHFFKQKAKNAKKDSTSG
jgi:phospholipid/cholesterol/gamma-HCH transport system substrate-binding protein